MRIYDFWNLPGSRHDYGCNLAFADGRAEHWQWEDDGIAKCAPRGAVVLDDHLFADPLLGYVNPADNKCGTGRLNIGSGPTQDSFNPRSTFGHMHPGPAEWWIVQVGQIRGRFAAFAGANR